MREIKFRGKRLDNGEWLYGSLLVSHFKDDKKERYFITQFSGNYTFEHEVDPATVGQYTGLKDKNGREIYEGDILAHGDKIVGHIIDDVRGYCYDVIYKDQSFEESCSLYGVVIEDYRGDVTVVGNIHDNPDLLKTE